MALGGLLGKNAGLTITSVSLLPDGTNVFNFTFSFTSSTGGGFKGSGTATWKHQ